ncbi:MAG: urea transporter [Bacteroidetes bacterium]|nr:urea transporter [Bacteroidota bacterium]
MTSKNQALRFESISNFIRIILRGISQIMLQANHITGFLFLVGIFYGSALMGVAMLVAVLCGTSIAIFLNFDKSELENGLYGFSAALVGAASMLFLKPELTSWIIVVVGSVAASVIQHFFLKRKIPVFTLPFVLVTWAILMFCNYYFTDLFLNQSTNDHLRIDSFMFIFRGFGQVIFQESIVSGVLFFIAVLINSSTQALYGLGGAVVSVIIAIAFSVSNHHISLGLLSFNAVLCAIVFAGVNYKDIIFALVSVTLATIVSMFMISFNITQLTFPFVLVSIITLIIKDRCLRIV